MTTLGTLKEATGHEAITNFLEERILPGSDWNLVRVRRRNVRLEPPHAYWATYRIRLGSGELVFAGGQPESASEPNPNQESAYESSQPSEASSLETAAATPELRWSQERELRLVARGVFDSDIWDRYRERVMNVFGGRECRPLDGLGYPVVFDESQHFFWFFPVDPMMPGLIQAADTAALRRLFRNDKRSLLRHPGRITDVRMELRRYLPEISAILRYDVETMPAAASRTIFGKVQPGDRSAETHRIMAAIWSAARASEGRLRVPEPLAHYPGLGLSLQSSVPGESLGSDRTSAEFQAGVIHAAEALATLHASGIEAPKRLPLDTEVARLDRTLDQFALVHPDAYFLLREFLNHLRHHLRSLPEEEWLPTHGDFKHDQILHDDGSFHIIDFDFFGSAETSFDLGKFCAYLMPSMPKGWEQTVAGSEARDAFLRRYLDLRPGATLQRFPIYESVNLAGRAMTMMWTQQEGWEKGAESLLVLAMERLKSRGPQLTAR